jgi:hypothetical protein
VPAKTSFKLMLGWQGVASAIRNRAKSGLGYQFCLMILPAKLKAR